MAARAKPTPPPLASVNNGRLRTRLSNEADPETGIAGARVRVVDSTVMDDWRERGVISDDQHAAACDFRAMYQAAGLHGSYAASRWEAAVDRTRGHADARVIDQAGRRRKVAEILLQIGERARTAAALVVGEGYSLNQLAAYIRQQGRPCTRDEAKGFTLCAIELLHAHLRGSGDERPRMATTQARRPLPVSR
jgi:hypothetical protein